MSLTQPPGPPRSALPSLYLGLVRDRLGLLCMATRKYGDAVRVAIGPKTLYIFNHPDHAKRVLADNCANYRKGMGLEQARRVLGDGLLTSEGDVWRAQRDTIQPAFQSGRMARQAATVAQEASRLVARLQAQANGRPVNLTAELTDFTLGVLGATLLDADLRAFSSIGHAFEAVQDQAMFEMVSLSMLPIWLPLPRHRRFRQASGQLRQIADRLVADRLDAAAPGLDTGDDVLSRLIAAVLRDTDLVTGHQQLRDQIITLLLAGHETTASTLGWALYLIDQNPEIRERLREEAAAVLGDRLPGHEDLRQLQYTARVISETLRLYPPVWALTRVALAEDNVGGYHVPAGADVMICPYTLHRHRQFWPDPDTFDPDRFADDQAASRPRYAYLPFGAGPRFCVGSSLGLLEATFVLAMLARDLTLHADVGFRAVPEPMLSLRIRGDLRMTVRPA